MMLRYGFVQSWCAPETAHFPIPMAMIGWLVGIPIYGQTHLVQLSYLLIPSAHICTKYEASGTSPLIKPHGQPRGGLSKSDFVAYVAGIANHK